MNIQPEVTKFLSAQPLKLFIGGQWMEAERRQTFETLNPATGGLLARVAAGDENEINRAVAAAEQALARGDWTGFPASERARFLNRLADLVDEHCLILAQLECLDVGKPLANALTGDVPNVSATLRYFADLVVRLPTREPISVSSHAAYSVRSPYGVCGLILPWNFPLVLLGWGLAPALAAGNTVVVKPAEDTPLSTLYFCKLVEAAGIPKGVINVVTGLGEVAGAALARHPGLKRMSFTGSPEVGRSVAEVCGRNLVPTKLELGGKGAAVVCHDADLESTTQALVRAITLNAGQVCCTATRWVIQKDIYENFVEMAAGALQKTRIGIGWDPKTEMGPLISDKQRKRVLSYLEYGERAGAKVLLRGGPATVRGGENGFFVKPALLEGSPDNVACRHEIFGPVAYLMPFDTEQHAIDLVNQSPYGLANSVWSSDIGRAGRIVEKLVAGNGWINAHNLCPVGIPYGGWNLSGMGDGANSPSTLLDYFRHQSVVRLLDSKAQRPLEQEALASVT